MSNSPTRLRFLLSLGGTKVVVLNDDTNLHIYSRESDKSSRKSTITVEHIGEALVK